MKIEAGKFYRTRDGRKVRVYAVDGGGLYTIHGAVYRADEWMIGRWDLTGSNLSHGFHDLISEWVDKPVVDWSKLAAWHRWVAMDEDGSWYAYAETPHMGSTVWSGLDGNVNGDRVPAAYSPTFSGDWKDSLVERPTE